MSVAKLRAALDKERRASVADRIRKEREARW
jgi:hypothetical protein